MKKHIACVVFMASMAAFCRPPMHGPRMHHPAPHYHRHHHHNGPFWTGVGIGLAGAVLAPAILPPPPPPAPIVAVPPPLATRVWIPARNETRYDSFGKPYIVTIPGHWQY